MEARPRRGLIIGSIHLIFLWPHVQMSMSRFARFQAQDMSSSGFPPKYRHLIGRPGIDVFWRETTWTHFLTLISKITDFSWAWYQEKPYDLAHYGNVWLKAAWVCLNSKYSSVLYWNMTWNSPKFESPWWHTSNLPKHWPTRWSYLY